MMRRFALAASFVLVLSPGQLAGGLSLPTDAGGHNASSQGTAQPTPGTQDMMKMHEQMMAQMKAADAKLDALVKEMNTATGDAKVNAVAAVVSELVRQHKSMHEHMGQMHEQMMGGRGMMMKK